MTETTRTTTVAQAIANAAGARKRCIATGNVDWMIHWTTELQAIEENSLPSGSGIDNGTTIDLDRTDDERIVLRANYHHMTDGFYDGWTEHTITVRPTFTGISLTVSGRNRDEIKEYLADTYREALAAAYVA